MFFSVKYEVNSETFCYREEGHVPAVCNYKLSDIFADLLDFAARFLVLGGRLVYWLPLLKHE